MTVLAAHRAEPGGLGLACALAVALSTVLNAIGVFTEDAVHWVNLLIGFIIALAAGAVVFGWFARRALRSEAKTWRTAVVCAALGLVAVPVFWSGLPPVLGGAGAFLGYIAFTSATTKLARRAGGAAIALGALAIVGDVLMYAGDVASRLS